MATDIIKKFWEKLSRRHDNLGRDDSFYALFSNGFDKAKIKLDHITKVVVREYDEECLMYFIEHQEQLLPERMVETPEEAEEFLEDCMAVVVKNIKEVRAYFEDEADITGMSNEELLEASEVFPLPSGRFLIVEA